MSVSNKTLAVIRNAALWQDFNGSGALNEEISLAIERIVPKKKLNKFTWSWAASSEEMQHALQQIGKPNKRKNRKDVKP